MLFETSIFKLEWLPLHSSNNKKYPLILSQIRVFQLLHICSTFMIHSINSSWFKVQPLENMLDQLKRFSTILFPSQNSTPTSSNGPSVHYTCSWSPSIFPPIFCAYYRNESTRIQIPRAKLNARFSPIIRCAFRIVCRLLQPHLRHRHYVHIDKHSRIHRHRSFNIDSRPYSPHPSVDSQKH